MAARAGVSTHAVRGERRRRGIARYDGRRDIIEWTEPTLSLLGTDTDASVAAELGIHRDRVTYRRRLLGIPAWGYSPDRSRSKVVWSRRALALLGTAPDVTVARKLRLSREQVWWKRRLLGVASFVPARHIHWPAAAVERLGKEPDRRIARDLGLRPAVVKAKRERLGLPPYEYAVPIARGRRWKTLLKLTNGQISARYGLSSHAISKLRREYGMPAPGRARWTPDVLRRLGTQSDLSIAREMASAARPSSTSAAGWASRHGTPGHRGPGRSFGCSGGFRTPWLRAGSACPHSW